MADLRSESVLVQAWKKTAAHLRQHSWYADTLELDYQSLRLPAFIGQIQERLMSPSEWKSSLLDHIPAPKAQRWELKDSQWLPRQGEKASKKLRPLAHVQLQDQVVATAMMLCLADRVESGAGDPRLSIEDPDNRKRVLAYGHRLFCDASDLTLRHRWGSTKLYRQFYHDYQTFLERPKVVATSVRVSSGIDEIAIVHSDLSKFYDRVRPRLLHSKANSLRTGDDDPEFFELLERVFDWQWREARWPRDYGAKNGVNDFTSVALPQGLVAAGFFANIVLRDFEKDLRASFGKTVDSAAEILLIDACYYVDDLRLVLRIPAGSIEERIEEVASEWLQGMLNKAAPGMLVEKAKTKVTIEGREKRFLVQQSKAAKRIQREVSGAFDMLHGTELIGAIEGFFHTQQRYTSTESSVAGRSGLLVGISDLRDDTAARFAAGKYRRTFRSLRPLLSSERKPSNEDVDGSDDDSDQLPSQMILSREQLDEKAQLFSAMLIEEWVSNPGNVRLLRVALDMYPEERFLDQVLNLLQDGWKTNGTRGARRDVRLYCLAEIFRAGATETGMVADEECLPNQVSLPDYHQRLGREAHEILDAFIQNPLNASRFPWFLMQQVYLYLSARNDVPPEASRQRKKKVDRLIRHKALARFLEGTQPASLNERAVYLAIGVTAFDHSYLLDQVAKGPVSPDFLRTVAEISPEISIGLWERIKVDATEEQRVAARSLGLTLPSGTQQVRTTVGTLVQLEINPFYEEANLLELADALLERPYSEWPAVLSPWQINCSVKEGYESTMFGRLDRDSVAISDRLPSGKHLFGVPEWCETDDDKQKHQLGMVLRFALRGTVNFHAGLLADNKSLRGCRYRSPVSHWEKQRHSSFQGRSAFGPPWLPISSKAERILFELLRWPGCGISAPVASMAQVRDWIKERLKELAARRGKATKLVFLEQEATWPAKPPHGEWERPLRIGIVQSVIPDFGHYAAKPSDPELLGDPILRSKQRRHLAALLEGVSQMLRVRETHRPQDRQDGRVLDLLVFPELAIHPHDIDPLILPFVRSYKCIVLFGLVYHPESSLPGSPLINSCLWMIPEWTPSSGFQVRRFEQGKQHLAHMEAGFFTPPISGFRPVQWQVEYHWHSDSATNRPLVLSAAVCYDATDLDLASDLRSRNDFFIICALNQDVGTFDRMAEGLHYHMFQGVMVVNNGQFGGSNLFLPFKEPHHRQVLHFHGQPQAAIAFAEVCPRKLIGRPHSPKEPPPLGEWKFVPAGWASQ